MRDPKRIDNVLAGLKRAWKIDPDMRLGQLVVNLSRTHDPFYVEDNDMLWAIQHYLDTQTFKVGTRAKRDGRSKR